MNTRQYMDPLFLLYSFSLFITSHSVVGVVVNFFTFSFFFVLIFTQVQSEFPLFVIQVHPFQPLSLGQSEPVLPSVVHMKRSMLPSSSLTEKETELGRDRDQCLSRDFVIRNLYVLCMYVCVCMYVICCAE